jgi:hypothetical protein
MPSDETTPFQEQFDQMEEWGAAVAKLTAYDANEKPLRAVIFVRGDETKEVVEAVQALEDTWD